MSNILKNLLIALAITLILVFVYYFFIKDRLAGDTDALLEGNLPVGSIAALEIERILADTQKINSYRIEANDDVLTSLPFRSLVDRRIDIQDVPTGRPNPFAPVN